MLAAVIRNGALRSWNDMPPAIIPLVKLELLSLARAGWSQEPGAVPQRATRSDLLVMLPPVVEASRLPMGIKVEIDAIVGHT